MLQPAKPVAAGNNNTSPAFPGNTIGFFNSISPFGTKFQQVAVMGPQSQKNRSLNSIVRGSNCLIFKPVEFAPGDTTLAWANKVINSEKYKDHLSPTTQPFTWRRELYYEFRFQFG